MECDVDPARLPEPASVDRAATRPESDDRIPLTVHLAGLTVAASVAALDPGGWYPFVVAKWSAVSIAVFVAWSTLGAASRGRLPRPVRVSFGMLVGVLIVAAVFGREGLYAWVGTPERQLGVFTWILFAAALAVGAAIDNSARRRVLSKWVVVALGWCVVYGALEFAGASPVDSNTNTSRLTGPYGSASFFGAALCLLIPIAFGLAADRQAGVWWRRIAFTAATFGVSVVALTGTRAAWLGLGVAATVSLLSWLFAVSRRRRDRLTRTGWTTLGGVAIGVTIGVVGVMSNSGVTERSAGGSSRLAEWGVGWRIVTAHPWLGVGPEGYRTALADGVTAAYERTYGRSTVPDRAHNVVIDVGAAGGVLAAALYVTLIGLVLLAAWRVVRSTDRSPVAVGMAIATVAYSVQQLFLFPLSTVDPIFWMLAGSTLVASRPTLIGPDGRRARVLRVAIGGLIVAVLFVNGLVAIAADRSARAAVDNNELAAAENAASLRPDVVRYRVLVASLEPKTITGQRAAIAETAKALTVSPHDPIIEQANADARLRLAISTRDADHVADAIATWERLASADPNCYHCALALGYAYALDGDADAAIDAFTRAAALAGEGDLEAESALRSLTSPAGTSSDESNSSGGGTDDEG